MIFPQIIRQKLLKGVGKVRSSPLFQNPFLLISPISHFLFPQIPPPLFILLFSFCSHRYLHIFSTISTIFSTIFHTPFFYLHFFTIFKTDFPSSRSPSLSHVCAVCLISSQIHGLYYYYYFYIFLFLFFFCNFTSFLHPFSKTLFISFNQPFPEQPAPLWK